MTETARIYGGSLYDLAAEENLTGEILGQMEQIRTLLRENPEYERLLSEPSIPQMERNGMIEAAFGGQAQRYLVNFMKLMCEKNLLGEYSGCFEAFKSRYYEGFLNQDNLFSTDFFQFFLCRRSSRNA